MTTLFGNLSFSGDAPGWANDGDESDFNVNESGQVSLNISINNGVVTGTATASNVAYSGSTPDDQDGDSDAFSVSRLSGTGTVSGTTSHLTATINLGSTAVMVLRGSLDSAGVKFTGNAQVFESGLVDGFNFNSNPPITLKDHSQHNIQLVIAENGNGYGTISANDDGQPIAGLNTSTGGNSSLCAYDNTNPVHLSPSGTTYTLHPGGTKGGYVFANTPWATDVELHIGNNPGDSTGCIVVGNRSIDYPNSTYTTTNFWTNLKNYIS
jgi:hypothetical protein